MFNKTKRTGIQLPFAIFIVGLPLILNAKLVAKPKNQAIPINGSVEIECETDSQTITLSWYMIHHNSSDNVIIYNGHGLSQAVQDYISVNHSVNGQYNLVINGTPLAGGHYTCIEPRSLGNASAEIIILHSDPVCNSSSNYTHTIAICSIRFSGNWPPEMHWTVDGEDVTDNIVTHLLLRNESLTSKLVFPGNLTENLFSCKTNFTHRLKPSMTTATNVPEYTNTWPKPATESVSVPGEKKHLIIYLSVGLFLIVGVIGVFICWCLCRKNSLGNYRGIVNPQ